MKILYEDNHILVVVKKPNVPVCEDDSHDLDLLTSLKQYLKEKYHKPGNVYLGLVHRLDRPVGGVMVFAKTSKAASRLSEQVRRKEFKKEYTAVVMGKIAVSGQYEDKLLKNSKTNITQVDEKGKLSILEYELLKYDQKSDYSLVKINLKTGRSHQIRVQFAQRKHYLYGDQRYNPYAKVGEQIALCATKLSFLHPTTKEQLTFEISLPDSYPWDIFMVE